VAELAEFLLAHVGIPLIAGLVLLFMVAASDNRPLTLDSSNDIALDFIILSVGATGAIFLNPRLTDHWKGFTPILGIVVTLIDLLLASILVYRRRWRARALSTGDAFVDLLLGILGLTITVRLRPLEVKRYERALQVGVRSAGFSGRGCRYSRRLDLPAEPTRKVPRR